MTPFFCDVTVLLVKFLVECNTQLSNQQSSPQEHRLFEFVLHNYSNEVKWKVFTGVRIHTSVLHLPLYFTNTPKPCRFVPINNCNKGLEGTKQNIGCLVRRIS
jgi:hypothetical protein